jgi:hypothetical protein
MLKLENGAGVKLAEGSMVIEANPELKDVEGYVLQVGNGFCHVMFGSESRVTRNDQLVVVREAVRSHW